jgi:hypothetical protein
MKKLFFILFLTSILNEASGQFFRGIGIFVGPNSTAHRYRNLGAPLKDPMVYNPDLYYPQNHYSHDYFSFATGLFLEFLRYDHIRWQTELEYTNKGAIEREIIDPYLGTRGGTGANVYQYIQWNNYLKFMGGEGDRGQWYTMLGAKIEYNLSRATPIFTPISGTFPKIWFSGDAAIGYEFFTWKRIHPFVEFHYNPDIIYQPPRGYTSVRSRTFELRIGLIYRPKKGSIDDCNAPTYHGNYY